VVPQVEDIKVDRNIVEEILDSWSRGELDVTDQIIHAIVAERLRQEKLKAQGKFTFTCADSAVPYTENLAVLAEEFGEVAKEVTEHIITQKKYARDENLKMMPPHREEYFRQNMIKELIQVAAICVAWCERLERDSGVYRKDHGSTSNLQYNANVGASGK
jgi:hypothetical protein